MVQPEYKEYATFVDTSILRELNTILSLDLCATKYFDFFEYDPENIAEVDEQEQLFKVDVANFVTNGFNLGVAPSRVGEVLAQVLIDRGWLP